MSIFGVKATDPLYDPRYWTDPITGMVISHSATASGAAVTPKEALTLSAYYAGLRAISEDIGKMPLNIRERTGDKTTVESEDNARYLLNVAPNDDMGAMNFKTLLTSWAIGWGCGYAQIEWLGNGQAAAFLPIHPSRVKPTRLAGGELAYEVRLKDLGFQAKTILQKDMLAIHGMGPDGITGYPISVLARETIGLGLTAEKTAASFLGNDARPSVAVKTALPTTPEAKKLLATRWMAAYGQGKAGGVAILDEGMEVQTFSIPPNEAQFLETRQFNVEEIARWLRIPPHKLQHLLHATFSNITEQNIEYVTDSLTPWGVRWEQELGRKLFKGTKLFAKVVFQSLLRGDPKTRALYYRQMQAAGNLSINQVRALEDMNPIPGGDTHFVAMNTIPLEQAIAGNSGGTDANASNDFGDSNDAERGRSTNALDPVFRDAAERVIAKEVKAVLRAAKKDGFEEWAGDFYLQQFAFALHAVSSVARVYCARDDAGLPIDHADAVGKHMGKERDSAIKAQASGYIDEWAEARKTTGVDELVKAFKTGLKP